MTGPAARFATMDRPHKSPFALAVLTVAALAVGFSSLAADEPLPEVVLFNRDIRPILSDTCFHCHGPDQGQRQAELRLDIKEAALNHQSDRKAIVPGRAAESELVRRIASADPDERMPPTDSGRSLTKRQIQLLQRWIEQGARWQEHWSLIAPQRPPLPQVKNKTWPQNPIDNFVLDRLEREGLPPSPPAERATLIRRVTLDLTGLPPTPAEVDAFLADKSPDAYEKVVDRLLASPRYGERMATRWLDAGRYADTNGYQDDGERHMWRWRDWVIDAYNRNLPFDEFTIAQIAGDLLPNATLDQKIATGFNRNHRGNGEGGIIPEEYAAEYVVDRVDTTSTVWLGLTLGCARCHDHKFDPVTQKEFYQLFAFFNNVPEKGKAVKHGNSPPMIKAPTVDQQRELAALDHRIDEAEKAWRELGPEIASAQAAWERGLSRTFDWHPSEGLAAHFALDPEEKWAESFAQWKGEGRPAFASGRVREAAKFDKDKSVFVAAPEVGNFSYSHQFSFGAWVFPADEKGGAILSRMADTPRAEGYSLCLTDGKIEVNLVKRWLDDAIRVETHSRLPANQWHHVFATYDGTREARGIKVYVDGQPQKLKPLVDELNQEIRVADPFRIGAGGGPESRFNGLIDDVRVYSRPLPAEEIEILATTETIGQIAAIPLENRAPRQARKIDQCFLATQPPTHVAAAIERRVKLQAERAKLVDVFPTTMVMEEMPTPRETFVLLRGQYDKPGEKVARGVPASLPPLPKGAPANRLGLAKWLVDPSNPLVARVAVNRFWQMYFGAGLVRTVDDFGSQGEWPSHPELLDWLATEFMSSSGGAAKWDVKGMQRLIVTSATYRQQSKASPALLRVDPENRLLARGPRLRLSAEMIRDQALAASGLLVEKVGGPSVKPYQPEGLWKDLAGMDYKPDSGESLYRRSMYTYWKRTVAPPTMMTFDASGREACSVRETRTNTPLQALTLMNDVTFVEAARALAQRVMKEGDPAPKNRITRAFRFVLGRAPSDVELIILLDDFADQLARFGKDRPAAQALTAVGASKPDPALDASELAAYTATANLILNLDETITKE